MIGQKGEILVKKDVKNVPGDKILFKNFMFEKNVINLCCET